MVAKISIIKHFETKLLWYPSNERGIIIFIIGCLLLGTTLKYVLQELWLLSFQLGNVIRFIGNLLEWNKQNYITAFQDYFLYSLCTSFYSASSFIVIFIIICLPIQYLCLFCVLMYEYWWSLMNIDMNIVHMLWDLFGARWYLHIDTFFTELKHELSTSHHKDKLYKTSLSYFSEHFILRFKHGYGIVFLRLISLHAGLRHGKMHVKRKTLKNNKKNYIVSILKYL